MCHVYVLRSISDGRRYVGMTYQPLDERLQRHNRKHVRSTKSHAPFEMIHSEKCDNRAEARKRERYLKSGAGREWLDRLLSGQ